VAGLTTFIEPEKKSTEALATTIRAAGKAFSVFDAARLVLQSGDRFHVKFTVPGDSTVKLCTIPADGSVWLGREEAVAHFLQSEGIKEFYRVEETELEEPKGNFTSVAVCGMTGELLGPASHHSYQTALHRIHRERFSDMRFEDYKRRVRTDNTPEAVEKWKESQKRGQVWIDLTPVAGEGAEPLKLNSRSEMEAHFRKTYAETLVHEATEAWVAGNIPKRNLSPALYHALRRSVEDSRKHLLPVAQLLCSGFEGHGLKLFKRRGGKLWVSRTRPKALDSSVVLSNRIARMLEVVKSKPGIAVKDLVEAVAPTVEAPKAEAPATSPPTQATVAPEATAESVVAEASVPQDAESQAPPAAPDAEAPTAEPAPHAWSTDQLHALQDLHWLNSEGYVIEYSDGIVFIGVTEPPPPKPKAVKPAAAPTESPAAPAAVSEATATEPASAEAAPQHEVADPAIDDTPQRSVEDFADPAPELEDGPAMEPFSFLDDVPSDSAEKASPDH
jgi:hypothetical protein